MHGSLKFLCAVLFFLFICPPAHAAGESAQNFYDLGVFAYEEGNYQRSVTLLKKALAVNPDDAYANFYLGKTYMKLDALPEAQKFLTAANMIDPEIEGLAYELGMLNQKLDNHDHAVLFYKKAIHDDPDDVRALYHAGISLFMIQEYEKALDYLLQSSEMSSSIKPNGYYYAGVCYYKLSDFDQAIEKFDYVKMFAETDALKEDAEFWLQTIRAESATQKPYSLYLKTGYQYDDNVLLAPVDEDIITDESDHKAVAYFSGRYDLINREKFVSGVGYSHYQTWHNDLDAFDVTGSIGEVYADVRLYPFILGLSYTPSYYWVDAESYLMQHQIKPGITWQLNENNAVTLSYSYYRNNYFILNEKDGHANEVALDAYHGLDNLKGYLFCSLVYEDNSAASDDEYFTELGTQIGFSYDILKATNITIYGDFFDKEYDHTDSVFGVKRSDARYFASLAVTRTMFFDWLSFTAEYTYTKNDSNISDYDYDRNTFGIYVALNL